MAAACGGGKGGPEASGSGGLSGTGGSGNGFGRTYLQQVNRSVDILFLIDDSSSMALAQNKLLQDFATFANTLQTLEGGRPNPVGDGQLLPVRPEFFRSGHLPLMLRPAPRA